MRRLIGLCTVFLLVSLAVTWALGCATEFATERSERSIEPMQPDPNEQAIARFTKAIELDPKHASAYRNRGVAYYRQGDCVKAVADLGKGIELDRKLAARYSDLILELNICSDFMRSIEPVKPRASE